MIQDDSFHTFSLPPLYVFFITHIVFHSRKTFFFLSIDRIFIYYEKKITSE